jgi:hypothetical protein
MGRGSTAAAASPQVTAVGLLGCADPTTLPLAAMMLTVYVSPDGWVDRTAKAPVRGTGDAAGEAVGAAVDEAVGDVAAVARGEVVGELAALAVGDAPACEPGTPQPAMSTATANQNVDSFTWRTPYSNANVRTALRFRYDPASEAGPDPHPQSNARTGTHGRLGLSVLFYVGGGILRTLNLAEVTSHLV